MTKRHWAGLTYIETISGTAQDGATAFRGFVTVRAVDDENSFMSGQLDPKTIREMAMQFLESAEAAEQDSIVMTMLTRDVGLDSNIAATFVSKMRDERND